MNLPNHQKSTFLAQLLDNAKVGRLEACRAQHRGQFHGCRRTRVAQHRGQLQGAAQGLDGLKGGAPSEAAPLTHWEASWGRAAGSAGLSRCLSHWSVLELSASGRRTARGGAVKCCCGLGVRDSCREEEAPQERKGEGSGAQERRDVI